MVHVKWSAILTQTLNLERKEGLLLLQAEVAREALDQRQPVSTVQHGLFCKYEQDSNVLWLKLGQLGCHMLEIEEFLID